MRIALEARALDSRGGGIHRYVSELIKALVNLQTNHEFHVLRVPLHHPALFFKWLWRDIPKALQKINPDIVHFTKVDLPLQKQFPTVVTIYDVIPILFPESQPFLKRLYWPRTLQRSASVSDHVITISEASKRDLITHLHIPAEKITVTPLGIDHTRFQPVAEEKKASFQNKYELKNPYILFASTIEPRKNVPGLIRAFTQIASHIPHDLVIAGRFYLGKQAVEQAIQESGLANRIHVLNFIENDDLASLYSSADLFAWPSIYEGWGLPPLEAMSCGTPVIVSNGGSLPEVVGDSGEVVFFSTHNLQERSHDRLFEQALSEKIVSLITNPDRLAQLAKAGQERARTFTWEAVAKKTIGVYEKLV